ELALEEVDLGTLRRERWECVALQLGLREPQQAGLVVGQHREQLRAAPRAAPADQRADALAARDAREHPGGELLPRLARNRVERRPRGVAQRQPALARAHRVPSTKCAADHSAASSGWGTQTPSS